MNIKLLINVVNLIIYSVIKDSNQVSWSKLEEEQHENPVYDIPQIKAQIE